jgi:phage terminase large subunit-like protein
MLEQYHRYIDAVLSGEVLTCKYVRLAVERQVRDLERQDDPDFLYYFDEQKAGLTLATVKLLRHTSGEWMKKPFQLQDFQAFRFAVLFGWMRKDNHKRRFRRAYIEVARKQGKSEEAAAVGNIGLHFDGEGAPEIFSAATTRDQAKIVFNAGKAMSEYLARDSESLSKVIKSYAHSITNSDNKGSFRAVSADAGTLDGLRPHMFIIDEYHAHPRSDVLKVGETGMGSRAQPLSYIITTAGFNTAGPCFRMRQVAIEILEGKKIDETFFTIIYTLDENDDWGNEAVWAKPNPNLGVSPSLEFLRSEYTKAVNEGGRAVVEFKTKNLNIWCDAPEVWITDESWRKNMGEVNDAELIGRRCFSGLDLAAVSDITSLCLLFPARDETEKHIFRWINWLPEMTVAKRSGRVNYALWVENGWLKTVPGDAMEYPWVIRDIDKVRRDYDLEMLFFDPWNKMAVIPQLVELALPLQEIRQGHGSMSSPSKEFERIINRGECNVGQDPVARWAMGNVVLRFDSNGNYMPDKNKSFEKIDPIVSAIMAVGAWQQDLATPKVTSYLFDEEVKSAWV